MTCGQVGRALGVHPNSLRYALADRHAAIRWDGARRPDVWTVPPPGTDPRVARLELARRYLHVYGPATPEAFGRWSGIGRQPGLAAFEALTGPSAAAGPGAHPDRRGLDPARGRSRRSGPSPSPAAAARLLPSGDAFFLLHGGRPRPARPGRRRRRALWTPRVWPGACSCRRGGRDLAPGRPGAHRAALAALFEGRT